MRFSQLLSVVVGGLLLVLIVCGEKPPPHTTVTPSPEIAHQVSVEYSNGWSIDRGNFTMKLAQQGNSWKWLLTGKSGCSSFMATTLLFKSGVLWGNVSEGICGVHITFFEIATGPPPVVFAEKNVPYSVDFIAKSPSYGSSFGDRFSGLFNGSTWVRKVVTPHTKSYPLG